MCYRSSQQSNNTFLFPRLLKAYGTNNGEDNPSWRFEVEGERGVCIQAFMWAYDAKFTTTHSMLQAVRAGWQEWAQYKCDSSDGNSARPAMFSNQGNATGANSSLMQECRAYVSIWLRDCTAGDSCPAAGEQIEIDPVDHLEVYKEYVIDMQARGSGACPAAGTTYLIVLHACHRI